MTALPPLKPCPFCGDGVQLHDVPDHLAANGRWKILCYGCDMEMVTAYIAEGFPGADKEQMRKQVIKTWNRRAK